MPKKGEKIYKRKDGRWEGRYRSGTRDDGRGIYRSVYGKSCSEVRKKLSSHTELVKEVEPLSYNTFLFRDAVSLWRRANGNRYKGATEMKYDYLIDKTKPVIVPIDFESNTQYSVELKTVSVEIKDNLVLEDVKVYLNDEEIKYSNQGETYTFDIPEKNEKQNVRIVAVDAAGNELEVLVEDFLVSANVFVRWFNNTPLFIGSIAGITILCGAIVFLTKSKRKKVEA